MPPNSPTRAGGISSVATLIRRTEVLWYCHALRSSEHCLVDPKPDGWTLTGVCVLPLADRPGRVEYAVSTDRTWRTRGAQVHIHQGNERDIEIEVIDGRWTVDGIIRDDLDGCTDIDLGWTPLTNTLPIRRHPIDPGQNIDVHVALMEFPTFELRPALQRYTRVSHRRWRYQSGTYDAMLDVDDSGFVIQYGTDLWTAITCDTASAATTPAMS